MVNRAPLHLKATGFTLIELLVVMAIIATLLSIVAPRYFGAIDKTKETVLRQDLGIMRNAIDQFYSDTGKYPIDLMELVDKGYMRKVPVDPFTESDQTWIAVPPKNESESGVYDVHSGYNGRALDGSYYEEW
ncbi:MAG: prepilin-type N-terminal cleavage/methylation domain-containing protein [Nitrosomonas sp.]|jgi:general secretion pathway protein G|uniref:type II secretion system protein n=1 Tax=Nitrosomonas sp. TaxID=42353 RepID=UPI001D412B5D|nr:prepilin-type N-terminal cleavage/methylation domain-containing protein [Nitrosomonas sp.]MBX9894100.1 prepilin-type N-terminal cleavage/methylation domain-containing protein [Nitrosomonas sp.]